MITTKCPACSAEGRVPPTKVNTRLVCPKCLKTFHVTSAGRSMPGEPPAPSAAAPKHTTTRKTDKTDKIESAFQELSDTVFTRKGLGVLGGLLAVGLLGYFFFFRKGEQVEDRAEVVAKAALDGDLQALRNQVSTGTVDETMKWYDSIRPQCDEIRQSQGSSNLVISVVVTQRDKDEGTADTIATAFLGEGSVPRKPGSLPEATIAPPSSRTLSIPMSFRMEGWSGWRLDGRRTLMLPGPGRNPNAGGGTPASRQGKTGR